MIIMIIIIDIIIIIVIIVIIIVIIIIIPLLNDLEEEQETVPGLELGSPRCWDRPRPPGWFPGRPRWPHQAGGTPEGGGSL